MGIQKIFGFTSEHGVPFVVRIVTTGECYGLNSCIVHEEQEPLVEFYDARYSHSMYGQFVARYHITTIAHSFYGLCLYGGEPSWNVDHNSMNKVREFLGRYLKAVLE